MRSLIVLVLVWLVFKLGVLVLGGGPGSGGRSETDRHQVDSMLRDWPEPSRDVARRTIADYGLPDGMGDNIMWWERGGDARLVLCRDPADAARMASLRP